MPCFGSMLHLYQFKKECFRISKSLKLCQGAQFDLLSEVLFYMKKLFLSQIKGYYYEGKFSSENWGRYEHPSNHTHLKNRKMSHSSIESIKYHRIINDLKFWLKIFVKGGVSWIRQLIVFSLKLSNSTTLTRMSSVPPKMDNLSLSKNMLSIDFTLLISTVISS